MALLIHSETVMQTNKNIKLNKNKDQRASPVYSLMF